MAGYDYASYEYLLDPLTQLPWPGSGAAPGASAADPDWDGPLSADARAFLDSLSIGIDMGFARLNLGSARTIASWYAGTVGRDFPVPADFPVDIPALPAPMKDILARFFEMYLAFAPTIHPYAEFVARSVTAAYTTEPAIALIEFTSPPKMPGQTEVKYRKRCRAWLGRNLYSVETLGWPTLLAAAVEVLVAEYPDLAPDAAGPRRATPPRRPPRRPRQLPLHGLPLPLGEPGAPPLLPA